MNIDSRKFITKGISDYKSHISLTMRKYNYIIDKIIGYEPKCYELLKLYQRAINKSDNDILDIDQQIAIGIIEAYYYALDNNDLGKINNFYDDEYHVDINMIMNMNFATILDSSEHHIPYHVAEEDVVEISIVDAYYHNQTTYNNIKLYYKELEMHDTHRRGLHHSSNNPMAHYILNEVNSNDKYELLLKNIYDYTCYMNGQELDDHNMNLIAFAIYTYLMGGFDLVSSPNNPSMSMIRIGDIYTHHQSVLFSEYVVKNLRGTGIDASTIREFFKIVKGGK